MRALLYTRYRKNPVGRDYDQLRGRPSKTTVQAVIVDSAVYLEKG